MPRGIPKVSLYDKHIEYVLAMCKTMTVTQMTKELSLWNSAVRRIIIEHEDITGKKLDYLRDNRDSRGKKTITKKRNPKKIIHSLGSDLLKRKWVNL